MPVGAYDVRMPSHYRKYREYYASYKRRSEVKKRYNSAARLRYDTPKGKRARQRISARYYERHRRRLLAVQKRRRVSDPQFAARVSRADRTYVQKLKDQIFYVLGMKCACCGETTPAFLTLDHINGGGTQHRKKVGGNKAMYMEIIREGVSKKKYRTLCMNCNFAIGHGGKCPHASSDR